MDRDGGGSREEANGGDGPTRRRERGGRGKRTSRESERERVREGEKGTGVAEKRMREEKEQETERERGRKRDRGRRGCRKRGGRAKERNGGTLGTVYERRKNPHARFYNENVSADATETNATIIERRRGG